MQPQKTTKIVKISLSDLLRDECSAEECEKMWVQERERSTAMQVFDHCCGVAITVMGDIRRALMYEWDETPTAKKALGWEKKYCSHTSCVLWDDTNFKLWPNGKMKLVPKQMFLEKMESSYSRMWSKSYLEFEKEWNQECGPKKNCAKMINEFTEDGFFAILEHIFSGYCTEVINSGMDAWRTASDDFWSVLECRKTCDFNNLENKDLLKYMDYPCCFQNSPESGTDSALPELRSLPRPEFHINCKIPFTLLVASNNTIPFIDQEQISKQQFSGIDALMWLVKLYSNDECKTDLKERCDNVCSVSQNYGVLKPRHMETLPWRNILENYQPYSVRFSKPFRNSRYCYVRSVSAPSEEKLCKIIKDMAAISDGLFQLDNQKLIDSYKLYPVFKKVDQRNPLMLFYNHTNDNNSDPSRLVRLDMDAIVPSLQVGIFFGKFEQDAICLRCKKAFATPFVKKCKQCKKTRNMRPSNITRLIDKINSCKIPSDLKEEKTKLKKNDIVILRQSGFACGYYKIYTKQKLGSRQASIIFDESERLLRKHLRHHLNHTDL